MDINILKKKLGLRLKELRTAKGLTQENLEKKYEFSYRYFGRMERGLVNPTLETLIKLSEMFDVTISDLFAFLDNDAIISEDREAVALKVAQILRGKSQKIKKLKIFLEEIL